MSQSQVRARLFANKSDLCVAESQLFSPWQFAPELLPMKRGLGIGDVILGTG